ncbi:MAG: hypothetical protein HY895_14965 [Deltaproteobacteria bacterium]|nr:hypothetical protein [Deltaproteobacteria bacterium]
MGRTSAALLMLGLLLSGCASSFDFRRQDTFEERVRQYGNLLRWSEFEAAEYFLALDASGKRPQAPQDVRVTDYQVKLVLVSEDARKAGQTVDITYFRSGNPRIKTLTDQQLWEFDAVRNDWFLKSGFPDFK